MTDAEREAQIRQFNQSDVEQRRSVSSSTAAFLLRLLDEARAEIARLRADANDIEVNYARELSRLKAKITRLNSQRRIAT